TQSTVDVVGNITSQGHISSVGSISAGTTLSAGGTISTVGNITATGNITGNVGSFNWLKCTASSGRPVTPTTYGAYLGNDGTAYSALEL
ncbi:MAG: hypothetical protein ACKPKO_44890, partial [Candidatus Fonsibacter sp.]